MKPDEQLKNALVMGLALKELKQSIGQYRQFMEYTSIIQKEHYDALVKQGFTPDQALYIVSNQGIDPGRLQRLQNLMEEGQG
jgi:hypothetical protein